MSSILYVLFFCVGHLYRVKKDGRVQADRLCKLLELLDRENLSFLLNKIGITTNNINGIREFMLKIEKQYGVETMWSIFKIILHFYENYNNNKNSDIMSLHRHEILFEKYNKWKLDEYYKLSKDLDNLICMHITDHIGVNPVLIQHCDSDSIPVKKDLINRIWKGKFYILLIYHK